MKNLAMQTQLQREIESFLASRNTLHLATLTANGEPYASYAPYALGDDCLYVLLSEIAVHAVNLQHNTAASVMVIEDEDAAQERFARVRLSYAIDAQLLNCHSPEGRIGLARLEARHGERIESLAQLDDFKLFRLVPREGRFVKGFGKAFALSGRSLTGITVDRLRGGHRKRAAISLQE